MRKPSELVHSRARVTSRYALMPLEGFPVSRDPSCPEAEVRVLASPALGAGVVEMLIDVPKGKAFKVEAADEGEHFYFVISGSGKMEERRSTRALERGSFGLLPPGTGF